MADTTTAQVHDLKCMEPFFGAVLDGSKRFELRENDRDYKVGDVLHLREVDFSVDHKYTGRTVDTRVTYVLNRSAWIWTFPGLTEGWVVLGIDPVESQPAPESVDALADRIRTACTKAGMVCSRQAARVAATVAMDGQAAQQAQPAPESVEALLGVFMEAQADVPYEFGPITAARAGIRAVLAAIGGEAAALRWSFAVIVAAVNQIVQDAGPEAHISRLSSYMPQAETTLSIPPSAAAAANVQALVDAARSVVHGAGWDGEDNPTPNRGDWQALRAAVATFETAKVGGGAGE